MNAAAYPLDNYELDDRYRRESGRVFLTGTQALVRIPLMQRTMDRAAGRNTAGFISGYRGSPLGAYDMELWRAKNHLDEHDIRFLPAVNEELAATAILGTQQVEGDPMAVRGHVRDAQQRIRAALRDFHRRALGRS